MYTYEDMVAMLQNGTPIDTIAAELSKNLNDAKAEADRLAAEKAAKEKAANEALRKRNMMITLYNTLEAYVIEFHPASTIAQLMAENGEFTGEDLDRFASQIDNLVETFETIRQLEEALGGAKTFTFNTSTDPIENFLNQFVRK